MPEPITPEQIQPQRLTIGETPVFFTSPLEVNGQQVTQLTLQGERARGKDGLENAVLLIKEQSRRRGEEGVAFSKPLTNVNAMEEVDWDKIEGLQYTSPDGSVHTIPKEQLSLTKPEETPIQRPLLTIATPPTPTPELETQPTKPTTAEPKLARSILEKYSGEPTTLTIVGLKAYETRAHDLAAKSMQSKHEAPKDILRALDNLGENIWKHGIGPVYFQEKARQYYMDMLKAGNSPFAEGSIKIAEAAGKNRYQELLDNKNFLTRGSRRFIEWIKSSVGARTLAQQFALEEIAHMRENGEIKEAEAFEREGASIRKRFEMDFTAQDDVIRKTLGEKLDILDPAKPEHKPLVDDIRGLVRRYATGEIATKADFDKASDELFQTHLKGARPDIFHEAELYSSSLYEVAESMRTKASHEGGLAAIDAQLANMQVRLGMGVMGEATALEPTDVQKGTEMVQSILTGLEKKGIIGPFAFNEVTVSTGVSLALSLAILPKTALSSTARFWGGFAGGAAIGAVFGGVREYRMLEREYLTHLREREAGLTFSPDAKRRAWMERFFVGQRSADDLITAMNSEDAQTKLANLADAKARRALSARQHERNAQRVGLIQFSGRENIETQRTALDLTIAQAEKDLLAGGKTNEQFLADLTAAQTRILSDGASRVEGLSDPLKVTLNLLDKYNPEVEVIRRRFPLLGPEAATGAKAQGLEGILKEFRTAARGAAIKKGLQVGLSGAIIGLGIREGLQIGSEVLSNISDVPHDLAPPADINPGQNFALSSNLHMDGTNLVTTKGDVVAAGFKDYMANTHGALNPDGTLSDNTKAFLAEQAQDHGVKLEIPEAVKSEFVFSGSHPLDHVIPGRSVDAPDQLHWKITDHGRELRMDMLDAEHNPGYQVLYADAGRPPGNDPDAILDSIKNNSHLRFIPEDIREHVAAAQSMRLDGIAPVIDAQGDPHFIRAMIPENMELTQTGDQVYDLIDSTGKHIITGIEIDDTGKIINENALNANDLGITFRNPPGEMFHTIETGHMDNFFDKPVSEMGTEHGASGPWGWLEDPINADKTIDHALPGTNLTKNLFRGFQENYLPTPEHANYTSLNPEDVYHNLPKALFEDTQLVKLGHIMDEAIKMKEVDGTTLENMDELHRAAYEIGRIGRVATKDEVQLFLDELGGTTKETTVQLYSPIIEQVTKETIPASIEGVNGSVVTNIITMAERAPIPKIPFFPIPIIYRNPLEPGVLARIPDLSSVTGGYYGYGYEGESSVGLLDRSTYRNRYDDRIRNQKDIDLSQNDSAIISAYIERQDPAYLAELRSLIESMEPMDKNTKLVITLPAYHEGSKIRQTLDRYAQMEHPEQFEIVIFENHPKNRERDNTLEEIIAFKKDHPALRVNHFYKMFDQKPTIGQVRKYLVDAVLLQKQAAGKNESIAIVSNDADLIDINKQYATNIIQAFESDPKVDALAGKWDFPSEAYEKMPLLHTSERLWQYFDIAFRKYYLKSPELIGRNSAYRSGIYAAVGGYNEKAQLGEDLEMGWLIKDARGYDVNRVKYLNTAWLVSNPRRAVVKLASGGNLIQQYGDFHVNEEVRRAPLEELLEKKQDFNPDEFKNEVQAIYDHYARWRKSAGGWIEDQYFNKSFDRAMGFMGITYHLDNGKVILDDLTKLQEGLQKFQERQQAESIPTVAEPAVPNMSPIPTEIPLSKESTQQTTETVATTAETPPIETPTQPTPTPTPPPESKT